MVEPEKPFPCTIPECQMKFTTEDHLQVHIKKHEMVLQFGCDQKVAFIADETPTPTRFIRNCEEVGLFQDLQNVNPFDEGFKRAMESKQCLLSLDSSGTPTEELHTPQMVFPSTLIDPGDCTFNATGHQRSITVSRSSSDESGVIKEFETTTISKLTNHVTISRIIGKQDELIKIDDLNKQTDSALYKHKILDTHNLRKHVDRTIANEDSIAKDVVKDYNTLDVPPIMSQKSIDLVVDSLTSDFLKEDKRDEPNNKNDYEVILKLPTGQQIKLTSEESPKTTKDLLKKVLTDKVESQKSAPVNVMPNVIPISAGTLIPVSIVNSNIIPKVPIKVLDNIPVKRRTVEIPVKAKNNPNRNYNGDKCTTDKCDSSVANSAVSNSKDKGNGRKNLNRTSDSLDSRSAASRRYRARLKEATSKQATENAELKHINERLMSENSALKVYILEHIRRCPDANDLRELQLSMSNVEPAER